MRRNAFASLQEPSLDQTRSTLAEDPSATPETQSPKPGRPLDFIPTAVPRKRRDRTWEKTHQDQVATYRGIPPEVREGLICLAGMLNVSLDEVARAFLEYGIAKYQNGAIHLNPYPKAQRMTLFATPENGKRSLDQGWLKAEFSRVKKTRKKKTEEPKPWEHRVSFRIPRDIKERVKSIADDHSVPIGEVVHYFLNAGLEAFQAGSLILDPQPKNIGNTLF
jgi:hypothetical protein